MNHEAFPVPGFEFMDEPATEEQKDIIHKLATARGHNLDRHGEWPDPFTRWDARNMIEALQPPTHDDEVRAGFGIFAANAGD
jgi:hypothetical protein